MSSIREQLDAYLTSLGDIRLNLAFYAKANKIPVVVNGKMDKGWRGNAVEHLLNLKKNNKHAADFVGFEIKSVPVLLDKDSKLKAKETVCLSVLDPMELVNKFFEESLLFHKIQSMVFVLIDVADSENPAICGHRFIHLDDFPNLKAQLAQDYETIAGHIMENLTNEETLTKALSGWLGKAMQPRPKTGDRGNYTWAFYLRAKVVNQLLAGQDITVEADASSSDLDSSNI